MYAAPPGPPTQQPLQRRDDPFAPPGEQTAAPALAGGVAAELRRTAWQLAGTLLLVQALGLLVVGIVNFGESHGRAYVAGAVAIGIVVATCFFLGSRRGAEPQGDDHLPIGPLRELQAIAFSVVGIVLLGQHLPTLAGEVLGSLDRHEGDLAPTPLGTSLAAPLIGCGIGLWLLLGSRGLATSWARLRGYGR